jgi:hypothetical protein
MAFIMSSKWFVLLLTVITAACSKKVTESNKAVYWTTPDSVARACPGRNFPNKYRLVKVNYNHVRQLLLSNSEVGGKHDTLDFPVPMPGGADEIFRIFPVNVMPDALKQKYPGIATYSGHNKTNAIESIRLDISPAGFRAMILSPIGTVLVDPYCLGDSLHIISYFKKDLPEGNKEPFEEVIPVDR